jgi:hypothetical protein
MGMLRRLPLLLLSLVGLLVLRLETSLWPLLEPLLPLA